jgi:DNA helicase-2/ATP-dependent DNA helicase PcrA
MATGRPEDVEEERRLLYVAMTRARDHLHLVHPLRFFKRQQHRHGDHHLYTPRSRFLPEEVLACFERRVHGRGHALDARTPGAAARVDVGAKLRDMWRSA